tara:strand:+ start:557 stop:805 length:249 start_codon:yes stop_codon:yes gene_type:complete
VEGIGLINSTTTMNKAMKTKEQRIAIAKACGLEWRKAYTDGLDDEGPCWCREFHFTGRLWQNICCKRRKELRARSTNNTNNE